MRDPEIWPFYQFYHIYMYGNNKVHMPKHHKDVQDVLKWVSVYSTTWHTTFQLMLGNFPSSEKPFVPLDETLY